MSKIEYENQEIIDNVDKIADEILKENGRNKHRDSFFPELINRLNLKIGGEIGVDKAGFSNHILTKTKIEKYYCIDTWQDSFGSNCKPGYFDKDGNVRFNEAGETLSQYGDRAIMIRKNSIDASKEFKNDSLDFVYIDGDHSLEMLFDLYSWMPKIKVGGICSGHDFKIGPRSGISDYWGKQLDYAVKQCVEYYCQRYGHKLNIVGGRILSWYFVKNR
jgi:hypothetical protein